jgi:hypothetical protein
MHEDSVNLAKKKKIKNQTHKLSEFRSFQTCMLNQIHSFNQIRVVLQFAIQK